MHSKRNYQQNEKIYGREKIFAKHTFGKGLAHKIYKEPLKLNNMKIKLKMGKISEQTHLQKRYTDGK